MTLQTFSGRVGSVHEMSMDFEHRHVDETGTVAHWFCDLPPAHPLWPKYLLVCLHLRDIPGQSRPPHRHHPDSSHEILLLPLNPELGPWTAENVGERLLATRDGDVANYLTPPNVVEQIRCATDEQAKELTTFVARALADGYLWAECDDVFGARQQWRAALASTLEHIMLGTHAVENRN